MHNFLIVGMHFLFLGILIVGVYFPSHFIFYPVGEKCAVAYFVDTSLNSKNFVCYPHTNSCSKKHIAIISIYLAI